MNLNKEILAARIKTASPSTKMKILSIEMQIPELIFSEKLNYPRQNLMPKDDIEYKVLKKN